jgi:ribosomal protein L11 methyltransferase
MKPDPVRSAGPQSWKVSLPCTRAEAEALKEDFGPLALLDSPPVLMTSEPDPARPDDWRLDAYFEGEPQPGDIRNLLMLIGSAAGAEPLIEPVPNADWVTISQAGLDPIAEGRFYIYTAAHADGVPPRAISFRIEASRAFGTGQHETTAGCLAMLDAMLRRGARARNVLDIGTGTGILAFAARRGWPRARVMATDIDPESIEVSAENAAINGLAVGRGSGRIELAVAAGMEHRRIAARAPYDLVIANILAGPLIALAPALASVMAEGGTLVLAGLLDRQAKEVIAAYRAQGFRSADRIDKGEWPTLRLRMRRRPGRVRPRRWAAGNNGEAPGFGSW